MPSIPPSNRNGGRWTEARFRTFIKSGLRHLSMRWPPKIEAKKAARTERGKYRCTGYKRRSHVVPVSLPPTPGTSRRRNNVFVDHIIPVIDVETGFITWDEAIDRMFCEKDNLQVLCAECHQHKTKDEKESRNAGSQHSTGS